MKNTLIVLAALMAMACTRQVDMGYDVKCVRCMVTYTDADGDAKNREVSSSWEYDFEVDRGTDLMLQATSLVPDSGVGQGYVVIRIFSGVREVAAAENYDAFGTARLERSAK